jgi:hypothetical protein
MGSILDEVVEFFQILNPSSCTMALGFTQPVTEISTRRSFWAVKHYWLVRLTTSLASVNRLSIKSHNPSTACYRDSFTYFIFTKIIGFSLDPWMTFKPNDLWQNHKEFTVF